MFYEYEWMLKRALSKLPKIEIKDTKFEPPKADVLIQGNKTIIRNFLEIADMLNRKPDHMIKYLSRELATAGNLDGQRLFLTGKFGFMVVNQRLVSYMKMFVICPACGRHETQLLKEDRVTIMRCTACGARNPVKAIV